MIIIEQDQEHVKRAVELHRNAAIDGFRLVRAEVSSAPLDSISGQLEATFSFSPSGARRKDDQLLLDTQFECNVVSHEQAQDTSIISVRCLFETRYDLRPDFSPSEDQIDAFQSANGIFNCWPFFREFVQSMVTRAGLPPPPVPFLRLQPKRAEEVRRAEPKHIDDPVQRPREELTSPKRGRTRKPSRKHP